MKGLGKILFQKPSETNHLRFLEHWSHLKVTGLPGGGSSGKASPPGVKSHHVGGSAAPHRPAAGFWEEKRVPEGPASRRCLSLVAGTRLATGTPTAQESTPLGVSRPPSA